MPVPMQDQFTPDPWDCNTCYVYLSLTWWLFAWGRPHQRDKWSGEQGWSVQWWESLPPISVSEVWYRPVVALVSGSSFSPILLAFLQGLLSLFSGFLSSVKPTSKNSFSISRQWSQIASVGCATLISRKWLITGNVIVFARKKTEVD